MLPCLSANLFELAQDPFGNFAVQKLIETANQNEVKQLAH